ncbi:MAG TPA: ATP-dependent DNA ligase [Bryobacteraceae bacterium]|nr:ATP-dependent DNA ligase [Bryobacteraceae bacterium]
MLLAGIVQTSLRISETARRLEKTALLANLLKQLQPEEAAAAVGFLSGSPRHGRIGIGYAALQNAMASAAETATLQILEADRIFDEISVAQGSGSEQRKRDLLRDLFSRATREEQRFLVGLLGGELRQGALEGIMLDSLAAASGVSCERIRRAAMMAGGSGAVARAVLEKGEAGLAPFDIQLFRPVQPMLAGTAEDTGAALASLGEAALEYKLDGARIQVHKSGDDVVVFSRGSNVVTAAVPEVVEAALALPVPDVILDGEVLSLAQDGRPRPFQVSMRRFGRKLEVDRLKAELPMTPFWFDLLYAGGSPLVDRPQEERFAELARLAPSANLIPNLVTGDSQRAEEFLHEALQRGHEGVMAKDRASSYAAGARGQSWLKIKQARTLDLVILAAEWGNGRRKGWLSNLHLGARDAEKGGFAMLGKTFKGLTDEMLVWQTQELMKLEVAHDKYTVYVLPKLVVEVAFNEVQASSRYVSGLALRFARVKRYRTDKTALDCDTFETVQKLASQ